VARVRKKGSSGELPFLCLVTLAQCACYEGFLSAAMSACSIWVYCVSVVSKALR